MKILIGLAVVIGVANAFYSATDDVINLTPSNFQKEVINDDSLWIVEFYAPWCGHCQSLTADWKKAATALRGVVKVGAVDADQHQSLGGEYGVRGFPTIKIFGANKNSPEDYQGPRSANGIVDAALAKIKTLVNDRMSGKGGKSGGDRKKRSGGGSSGGDPQDVIELTDSNFEEKVFNSDEMWLVEFFAPWCGHCKNLAPHWQSAASELKGKVKLGALDATVHTVMASRFGVQGYPTIKMFPAGAKDGEAEEYTGGRTSPDIVAWALDQMAENLPPPEVMQIRGYPTIKVFPAGSTSQSDAQEYDGGRTSGDIVNWAMDRVVENIPPPEVVQLTEEAVLKDACDDHQLCIIAIIPHILDCQSDCRNGYLSTLKALADKFKKKQWGWVWAEAGAQLDVEEALGIGGFGYPALAAMNSRKMKYSILKGAFSDEGINQFLRALEYGRGSTAPVKNAQMPKVYKSEAWDGKDGELPVEEDIDLSDVVLDDLDEEGSKDEL